MRLHLRMSPTRKQGRRILACASGSCFIRAGLTLLEVIVSLAIFLFSMVALLHLLSQSGQNALDGSMQTEATLRCQSKLAEIMNGAVPMSSSGWSAFEEAPDWSWEADCQTGQYANLYNVQVGVRRKKANGTYLEVRLSQMMVAPAQRGSTLVSPVNTSGTTGSGGTTSSGGN
jgi:type II secretion system protein I